jgi:hypothetical protein
MCKAKNITKLLLQEKQRIGFNNHDKDSVNECQVENCDDCKKEICFENDFISTCKICELTICIDCKEITLCDLCWDSFCKDCRNTVEVDRFVYCIDCKVSQENEFYKFLLKGDHKVIDKLLNTKAYSQSFIDIMFINSIFHYNTKIISFLFDLVSNQNVSLTLAFNSFIASRSFNTINDYKVLKFLLTNSGRRTLTQANNYFTNHPEFKYSSDIIEYIELLSSN